MLERVEVLRLVDEEVSVSPPHRVGELVVAPEVANRVGEHVVEVDHASAPLQDLEVGVGLRAAVDAGGGVAL